jgi:hypothetical protein
VKALRCHIGKHHWIITETRPVQWIHDGTVLDAEIKYRQCTDCGQLQRQDFWTGQYEDAAQVNELEPDPGVAPDLD